MGLNLSEEQRRRIEHEERVRLAEEQYRAQVRERLASAPPEKARSGRSSGRTILIVLVVMFIAYVILKSQ
jgi:hypothetical protein